MSDASPNFGAILDRAPTEVERPKPLPQGSYHTILEGMPRYDKSSKKQTEFVEFTHKFLQALDDVDEDALQEVLTNADGSTKVLSDITRTNPFYLTEGAVWRLKEFLGDLGFDVESDEQSMRQMIEQTAGMAVGVHIKHEPSQDGKGVFAEIDATFEIEED